jgi:hypothetical protein
MDGCLGYVRPRRAIFYRHSQKKSGDFYRIYCIQELNNMPNHRMLRGNEYFL